MKHELRLNEAIKRQSAPHKRWAALGLAVILTVSARAQSSYSAAPSKTSAASGEATALVNSWLREQSPEFSKWDVGGQFRVRYEIKENAGSFPNRDFIENGQDNDNSYLLLREKIHIGYTPVSWFTAYAEGRDSSTTGDDRDPNAEADQFDLHQAFIVLGDPKKFPLTLKVGRQEMTYGDERFVGVSDWNNLGRTFDAAKVRFENELLWVDAFVSRVIVPRDGHFNVANDYDFFSGIYASSKKLIPWQETDLFFFAHNVGPDSPNAIAPGLGGPTARDVYTIGGRVKSLPGRLKGWDFSAEVAGQFGSVNIGGTRLDHHALAADATAGYTWTKVFGSPQVGIGYTYASGDRDPNDGKNETFDLLFGTNHRPYGVMDLWGLRNIHSPRLVASLAPTKKLSLSAEYHVLWLADTQDFFFSESAAGRNANGYGRNPQFDSFVGSELDLVATYSLGRFGDLQAGYGHFFVGDYIKQSVSSVSANGHAEDADWVYLQIRFNF